MLARNLVFNVLGQLAPLTAAAVIIPILISGIGTDRFGMLTIAWMVVGYFSIFDLGLGRAMTRIVAAKVGANRIAEVPQQVWTGLVLMSLLGSVGGVVLLSAARWLTSTIFVVPAELVDETINAFQLLALSVPAVVVTTALRGVLEAHGRFDITNAIRVPMGLWTFVGPLLAMPFSVRLHHLVTSLVAGRVVTMVIHVFAVSKAVPHVWTSRSTSVKLASEMLSFGGWMTISNVVGPAMVYMDRFFIGAILGISTVAYYTTPYELVFKLNFYPEAVFGVLFPAMASKLNDTAFGPANSKTVQSLYAISNKVIVCGMLPVTLSAVIFAGDFLRLWLGEDFAAKSTVVMQVLAVGLCLNSISKVAFNLLQAKGRPDVTAGLHLAQLPVYVLALWALATRYGIEGAAVAWTLRIVLDQILFTGAAVRFVGLPKSALKSQGKLLAMIASLFACAFVPVTLHTKIALWVASGAVFAAVFWNRLLTAEERAGVVSAVRTRRLDALTRGS